MQDLANKKIVLGVCGGIAAYKAAYLVRELTNLGAEVRVVMTAAAQQFISSLTFQALSGHEVRTALFDEQAERAMGHIELARWADYFLVAPASANCLAKMANGLADDLLTTIYLVAETPVIICPAMNRSMWLHPATKANCAALKKRGAIIVGPEEGPQACGEQGFGRLSDTDSIINALRCHEITQRLEGQQLLITAGPTHEAIDPVRYLSNHSSGKMGYALAQAAVLAGARVILVTGPTHLIPPAGVETYRVESAKDMYNTVMASLQEGMIFIGTAAVADYGIASVANEKIKKKGDNELTLTLAQNPDILKSVAASGKAAYVVGFAAETNDVIKHAQDKLNTKKADMIIANQVGSGLGFGSDYNQVIVLTKNKQLELPYIHKTRLAARIIAILAATIQNDTLLKTEE
ncbi:bifunctional phosphopantothenoylcysteine decarboxylase/phosphopantothenate--cysteine ligase CoaBC [Legionella jamestowniensis]|uniref:Coenzyme A biosynthesis bifunctional protein CoaBC n=1 Tax=Legionella jamestowniensis TaxID=455 RepID=A0A0W0UL12_9GAMM|nr:bifunctional phosphopantothenoylcysteine decarboxylase/phosphopantothenate--cysteine ligase CoaBC [Legionella jamestowniensis]KTD08301.1 bifunctional phosphopantothenoylcysteine decarboxylase/phosphopantothenate synthase [Legionella jamestowniensis]SFL49464.1 Phosphopantothenate-cysteine ligase [Legionella jamestowniensis DSM 19215]